MTSKRLVLLVSAAVLLGGCATGNHGTFVTSTFMEPGVASTSAFAGKVRGESSQTWILYIFPMGEAPSTDKAIADAMSIIEDTRFLTDLSIDDKTFWEFGYSVQVISVDANAYK